MVESRIIFLGTAGDMMVVAKQIRASGGFILQYDDLQMHINPGPGSLVRYKQYDVNVRETDAIVVSANTTLHANDVSAVIDAMTNAGLDKKGVVVSTPMALAQSAARNPLIQPHALLHVERVVSLKVGDKVALNAIEITPTMTDYSDPDSVGFQIVTPKFVLSYVGDTNYTKKICAQHESADILILNVPFLQPKSDEAGLTINDAIQFVLHVKPILVLVTGFGHKILETDILEHIRRIQHETKVQTMAAKDGMVIDPLSFSSALEQKKLI